MNGMLHHLQCHSSNSIMFCSVLPFQHPSNSSSMMLKAVLSCLRGETFFFSFPALVTVTDIDVILTFCVLYVPKSLLCHKCNFWFESAMFSMTRFYSSQHSMGPTGLLDLCKLYSAANKWNKLNMGIIRHYQSEAGPQGFQVAWGF